MAKDRLSVDSDYSDSNSTASSDLSIQQNTCEMIFEGFVDSEDYYKTMISKVFLQWIKNCVLLTLHKLYPDKKIILVLDNASYHFDRGDDWVSPGSMNKGDLAKWIATQARQIQVTREGETISFKSKHLAKKRGESVPTLEELRVWAKAHLKANPDINRTELQKRFEDSGDQLLYTPPY